MNYEASVDAVERLVLSAMSTSPNSPRLEATYSLETFALDAEKVSLIGY